MSGVIFYTRTLPVWRCQVCADRPATVEVTGTGNTSYAKCCAKCAPKKIKQLEETHNRPAGGV